MSVSEQECRQIEPALPTKKGRGRRRIHADDAARYRAHAEAVKLKQDALDALLESLTLAFEVAGSEWILNSSLL